MSKANQEINIICKSSIIQCITSYQQRIEWTAVELFNCIRTKEHLNETNNGLAREMNSCPSRVSRRTITTQLTVALRGVRLVVIRPSGWIRFHHRPRVSTHHLKPRKSYLPPLSMLCLMHCRSTSLQWLIHMDINDCNSRKSSLYLI